MAEKDQGIGMLVSGVPSYTLPVGMVYCFNLMMGAGLIALPKAFVQSGWVLGLIGITVLAFFSYITVTYIIEAQSVHDALLRHASEVEREVLMRNNNNNNNSNDKNNNDNDDNEKNKTQSKNRKNNKHNNNNNNSNNNNNNNNSNKNNNNNNNNTSNNNTNNNSNNATTINNNNNNNKNSLSITEKNSSLYLYEITMKTELGELCNLFLNKFGYATFYIAFCFYLFGSLAVYAAAVSKSLASFVCKDHDSFHTNNHTASCYSFPKFRCIFLVNFLASFSILICFSLRFSLFFVLEVSPSYTNVLAHS